MNEPETPVRPVLLYDGACRFCRFAARAVARLDRADIVISDHGLHDEARAVLRERAGQLLLADLADNAPPRSAGSTVALGA